MLLDEAGIDLRHDTSMQILEEIEPQEIRRVVSEETSRLPSQAIGMPAAKSMQPDTIAAVRHPHQTIIAPTSVDRACTSARSS